MADLPERPDVTDRRAPTSIWWPRRRWSTAPATSSRSRRRVPGGDRDADVAALRRRRVGSQRAPPPADPPRSTTRSTSTGSASSGSISTTCPQTGGALLVANHAGAIPPDAPAIMHGIETAARPPGLRPRREPVPLDAGRRHAVGARRRRRRASRQRVPPAARRRAARARVPRGHEGHRQALHRALPAAPLRARAASSRSRCARACRSIPIAVVGAEESMPIVFKSSRVAKLLGHPVLPDHREHADDGTARARRLPPRQVPPPRAAARALRRRARPGALLAQPRDGRVGAHPHAWCRTPSTTCCAPAAASGSGRIAHARARHGLEHLLGWPGRAGARAAARRRGRRRRRHARPAHPARAHRVRAHRLVVLDPRPHRGRDPGRHDPAHAPHRRLDAREQPHAARDQRDRHDEPARGRGRVGQPGAQGRAEELGPRLRRGEDRPVLLPRGHDAHERADAPTSSVRCSRSRRSCATSPTTART